MKHTQGEWKIGKGEIFRPASNGSISPYYQQICSFINNGSDECEANAKLVAAAPDLLEALKACSDFLEIQKDILPNKAQLLRDYVQKKIDKATK